MIMNDVKPKVFLRMTRIIYFALWGGLFSFLITAMALIEDQFQFSSGLSDSLILITFLLSCINLPAGYFLAKMLFKKIDQNDQLKDKLNKYQTGQIIRLAFCEGVGFLAIVSLLLTSNLFFLIFLFISLFVMVVYYPTPEKIGREINLTQNEVDMFGYSE